MQKFSDQAGPSGLMTRPDSSAVVAVKVFKEKHVISKVRIILNLFALPEHGPLPFAVEEKNVRKTPRQFLRNLPQIKHLARPGRTLDLQIVPVIMVEFLKRFDQ